MGDLSPRPPWSTAMVRVVVYLSAWVSRSCTRLSIGIVRTTHRLSLSVPVVPIGYRQIRTKTQRFFCGSLCSFPENARWKTRYVLCSVLKFSKIKICAPPPKICSRMRPYSSHWANTVYQAVGRRPKPTEKTMNRFVKTLARRRNSCGSCAWLGERVLVVL